MENLLNIVEIGHPVLRVIAEPVARSQIGTDDVQRLIDQMIATKRAANGAGIAASQVDKAVRIFVVEAGHNQRYPFRPEYPLTVLINPAITFLTEDRFDNFEGCLSIPGMRGVVQRCPVIRVSGLDRVGQELDFEVRGVSAGIFQHEMDHLDGVLYTDKLADPKTLCTAGEFAARYEDQFKRGVIEVERRYVR